MFLRSTELSANEFGVADVPGPPESEEKGASQKMRLTGANKRMFNLLKKAKVQLIKIDQQKQLKSSGVRLCDAHSVLGSPTGWCTPSRPHRAHTPH